MISGLDWGPREILWSYSFLKGKGLPSFQTVRHHCKMNSFFWSMSYFLLPRDPVGVLLLNMPSDPAPKPRTTWLPPADCKHWCAALPGSQSLRSFGDGFGSDVFFTMVKTSKHLQPGFCFPYICVPLFLQLRNTRFRETLLRCTWSWPMLFGIRPHQKPSGQDICLAIQMPWRWKQLIFRITQEWTQKWNTERPPESFWIRTRNSQGKLGLICKEIVCNDVLCSTV